MRPGGDALTEGSAADGRLREYTYGEFQPSAVHWRPKGAPWVPFAIWTALSRLPVIGLRHYAVHTVYLEDALVHYTVVLSRYLRFPFMAPDDLEVGPVFTSEAQRRRGIAISVLRAVTRLNGARRLWYVVEADNEPSIALARKAGFRLHARGRRRSRFGLSILAGYAIEQIVDPQKRETTKSEIRP